MITRYILVDWNLQMVLILIFQRIACVTSPLIPATHSTTSSRSWNIVVCINNPVKMLFDKFSEKYGASKVRFSLSVLQLFTRALRYVLTDKRNNEVSYRLSTHFPLMVLAVLCRVVIRRRTEVEVGSGQLLITNAIIVTVVYQFEL